jgi:hypothetical protein
MAEGFGNPDVFVSTPLSSAAMPALNGAGEYGRVIESEGQLKHPSFQLAYARKYSSPAESFS